MTQKLYCDDDRVNIVSNLLQHICNDHICQVNVNLQTCRSSCLDVAIPWDKKSLQLLYLGVAPKNPFWCHSEKLTSFQLDSIHHHEDWRIAWKSWSWKGQVMDTSVGWMKNQMGRMTVDSVCCRHPVVLHTSLINPIRKPCQVATGKYNRQSSFFWWINSTGKWLGPAEQQESPQMGGAVRNAPMQIRATVVIITCYHLFR